MGRNDTATAESSATGKPPRSLALSLILNLLSLGLSLILNLLSLALSLILNLLSLALSLIVNLLSVATGHWRQARRRCEHPAHWTAAGTRGWASGRRVCRGRRRRRGETEKGRRRSWQTSQRSGRAVGIVISWWWWVRCWRARQQYSVYL